MAGGPREEVNREEVQGKMTTTTTQKLPKVASDLPFCFKLWPEMKKENI